VSPAQGASGTAAIMNITPEELVANLGGPNSSAMWRSLVECGPDVKLVAGAFPVASVDVKVQLLGALREWRTPECVPIAEVALQASEAQVWKEALDILVTIGGARAAESLRQSLVSSTGPKWEWVEEALQQVMVSMKGPG